MNRRPLHPEAKYRRGLPAPQHAWPGTDRPWVSAGVHRWPWRLSLGHSVVSACAPNSSGHSRMRLAMRLGLTSSLMFDDGRKTDCLARREGSRDQHESMLLSRQPRGCKASVLCISLWMVYPNTLVSCYAAVDERGCGKVDNRRNAAFTPAASPLLSTCKVSCPQCSL